MTPSVLKSSLLVTGCAVVTYLLSFVSQVVIARYFGASGELDAYLTAYAIPGSTLGIVLTGIGFVVVPMWVKRREENDGLKALSGSLILVMAAVALTVAVLGAVLANSVVALTAPGLDSEKLLLASRLQVFFWIAAGFWVISNLFVAIEHARNSFFVPALGMIMRPLLVILGALILAGQWGIFSLAVGHLVAYFLLSAVLAFKVLRSLEVSFSASALRRTMREFFQVAFPVVVSLLPFGVLPAIDAFWSSKLPEASLSYLGYATRIAVALSAISAYGMAVVSFPLMVEGVARGDMEAVRQRITKTLKFTLALMIPLACWLVVLRTPFLTVVFQRGRFDEQATQGVAAVLPWYLFGALGLGCMFILSRGIFALAGHRAFAVISLISLGVYFIGSGILSGIYSYIGIGISYAIYWTTFCMVSGVFLGRQVGMLLEPEDTTFLLKVGSASLVAAYVVRGAYTLLAHDLNILLRESFACYETP